MSFENDIQKANNHSTVRVNVWDYPSVECPNCGNTLFVERVIFKNISGLAMGMGAQNVIQPVPVYVCSECNELMPDYAQDMTNAKYPYKPFNKSI